MENHQTLDLHDTDKDTYGLYDTYRIYNRKYKQRLTFDQYKKIVEALAKEIIHQIVYEAKVFSFKAIGHLYVTRVKRTFDRGYNTVDYSKCKRNAEGKIEELSYYEDDFYVHYKFKKTVPSSFFKLFCKFQIAGGDRRAPTNNKVKLARAVQADKWQIMKYLGKYRIKHFIMYDKNKVRILEKIEPKDLDRSKFSNIMQATKHGRRAYGNYWDIEFTEQ